MRNIILFFSFLVYSVVVHGQVDWRFSVKKVASKTYELHIIATVDEPWHIYSQTTPKGGPRPTQIVFKANPLVTLIGKVKEVGEIDNYHDEVFNVDVYAFGEKVDFVQTVKLKGNIKTNLAGSVTFMACTKERCLTPKTIPFNVKLD